MVLTASGRTEQVPAPPAGAGSDRPEVEVAQPSTGQKKGRRFLGRQPGRTGPSDVGSAWYVPATALGVLAVLLLGFCAQVLLVGHVSYARAQHIALSDLRSELARGTAPVGQTFTPPQEVVAPSADGEAAEAPPPPQPLLHPLGTPMAVMSIEAIGLRDVVVLEGTTSGVTQDGPGHERNSVFPGQEGWSLVYGRAWSYGGPFRRIATLQQGDEIVVTTGQGKHTYRVTGVRRPGDPIPQRAAGQGRLVLGTASGRTLAPDGVVYVDALLTSEVQPTPARQVLPLADSEAIMAGDPSAWFSVLLWVQALTLAVLGLAWARVRWGRVQAMVVGLPLLVALGVATADTVVRLLPNVL